MRISSSVLMAAMMLGATFSDVQAGQTVISGGATLRQDYDSNIYRTDRDRVNEWTTAFSPTMSVNSSGQHYSLVLRYTPTLIYSHLHDKERWDHLFTTSLQRSLSERVSFSFSDTFVRAEDPYNDREAGIELSDNRGRDRYWTNNAAVALAFDYARDSSVRLSYTNLVLDNDNRADDDYVKHTPGLSMVHLFSQHWQGQADYSFTKGNFDQADDLESHAGDLFVYYLPSPASKVFIHGGYTATRYAGPQEDYDLNRISMGYERRVSPTTDFLFEGGGIFMNRDEQENKEAFYYLFSLNKKIQRGVFSLTGEGGIDEQQFNGGTEQNLSRYWQIQGQLSYSLTENLLSSLLCSYREDTYWERTPEEDQEELVAEAGLTYSFWRWYTVSVKYAYSRQESDLAYRCYDDNRVFLELGFNKDFFRW